MAAAAVLTRAGFNVTVLEAHVYPGGSAGTFYHQGYRFDAGATLAGGFYPGGPMDMLASAAGIDGWPLMPEPRGVPPRSVHLPGSIAERILLRKNSLSTGSSSKVQTRARIWELGE